MQKKLLSILLAFSLMVQMSPVTAMAEDMSVITPVGFSAGEPAPPADDSSDDTTGTKPEGDKITAGAGASGLLKAVPWNGTVATEIMPTPDENSVYQIGTAAELAGFRTGINSKTLPFSSNAVLTADIDLGGNEWVPISTFTSFSDLYKGNFNGQGHIIKGLFISDGTKNQGLFGYVSTATIENLRVDGDVTGSDNYVGGIVGSTNKSTITNCSFSGTVTSPGKYVGGIIGGNQSNPSTVSGCVNMATVSGDTAGGILGYSTQKNTIENCYNTGDITGTTTSGGIVGKVSSGAITSCYNIGSIDGAASGGIYGAASSAVVMTYGYRLCPVADEPGDPKYSAARSVKIDGPEGLVSLLNSGAFIEDSNGDNSGYPVLSWQNTTPSVALNGGTTTIYVNAYEGKIDTTLLIKLNNMEESDVDSIDDWKVTAKGDTDGDIDVDKIVTTAHPQGDKKSLIVTSQGGGTVTVTATLHTMDGKTLEATKDITVIPWITTAEIVNTKQTGAVAMGQEVEVKVYVRGRESYDSKEYEYDNYPPLSYQWRYKDSTPSGDISGEKGRTYTIPTSYTEWDNLYVEIKCDNKVVKDAADVKADLRSQDYGILYPVAYDPAFTLPEKVKDDQKLILPTAHTVGERTANIIWSFDPNNNTGVDTSIIDLTTGAIKRPATGKVAVTLTAKYTAAWNNAAFANRTFKVTVYSKQAATEEDNKSYLQQAVESLDDWYGPMEPVYGSDTNITSLLKADLADKGYGDLSVAAKSITERSDGAGLASNGDITYFYADPNVERGLWFGQYGVTFTLSKDADTLDTAVIPVNIHWDRSKVEGVLRSEILPGVTEEIVLGENIDKGNVISSLVLPKVVDGKMWAQIEWSSSDPSVVLVSNENQGTADTLLDPYTGKIIRGEADKEVTLTAKFNFQRTVPGQPEIALYKTFTFTVPALTGPEIDAIRAQLLGKLNTGFDTVGLRDYVTGEKLTEKDGIYTAANDIQLPTTRDFGVDGKYFPITITGSDSSTLVTPDVANAARVTVYRPRVGAPAKTAVLTVSITDLARSVSASKSFTIEAQPLVQSEIDDALALMDMAKTAYFEGLNDGKYADDFSLTGGLHPFQEAVWDTTPSKRGRSANAQEATGELRWIYDSKEVTKGGIVADELDNWADQEAWRAFRSSDMTILDSETLNHVTQPGEDTFVRVNSTLTHAVYGKYAGMEGYEDLGLENLSKQDVAVYVMVAGKHHPVRTQSELIAMREEAIARIETPISAGFTLLGKKPQSKMRSVPVTRSSDVLIDSTVGGLEAGTTVFGLFRKALAEQNYTYKAVGSYVKSVTDADGNTLAEGDAGGNSGWIYTVNGKMPSIYMNGYALKEGDEVVVRFTEDYTKEDSFDDSDDDKDDNGSTGGKPGISETPAVGTNPVAAPVAADNTQKGIAPAADSVAPVDNAPAAPQAPVAETPALGDGAGEVNGAPSGEPAAAAASANPIAVVAIVLVLGAALAGGLVWMKKRQTVEKI